MSFFQNVFASDFEGNWVLGDRQHIPKFVVPQNTGRGDEYVVAWTQGPYDLSGNDSDGTNTSDTLEIMYALREPKNWAEISVDIMSGADDTSAVTAAEVVIALRADTLFAERFTASLSGFDGVTGLTRISIRQKKPITEMRFYIKNGRAEEAIRFNGRAGVQELPTYFTRHSIDNRFSYTDSQNHVIELDVGNAVDLNVVLNAVNAHGVAVDFGWDGTTQQADWELLRGKSGMFDFTNSDGSSDPNTKIIYSAGAIAGDLAKKIITSGPDTFVIPYTLTGDDLITPP
jgi:hypothetical protein